MKPRPLAAGLPLILLLAAGSAHAEECSNFSDQDCRDAFVRSNMPVPVKPDLSNEHALDFGMNEEIIRSIKKARELEGPEKVATDRLKDILSRPKSRFSMDVLKRNLIDGENVVLYDAADETVARRELAEITTRKFEAYNDAIARTIDLYHLVPKITETLPHPDAAETQPMSPWRPHYSEHVEPDGKGGWRTYSDEEKRDRWAKRGVFFPASASDIPDIVMSGTDINTNNIAMFRAAFYSLDSKTPAPARLAAYLYHEAAHWLDNNALGRSPTPSEKFHSEAVAYQAQMDNAVPFDIKPDEAKALRGLRDQYTYQSNNAPATYGELKENPKYKNWEPAENIDVPDTDIDPHTAKELDRVVANAIESARYEAAREKEENARRAPKDPGAVAVPAQLAPPDPPIAVATPARLYQWENVKALERIAGKACTSPQSLADGELRDLQWFPNSDAPEATRVSATLAGCDKAVFDRLVQTLGGGYSLNAATVRGLIPPPRPPVATPRRVPRDRGDDPPSRHSPDDWNSLRQLRGIGR